MMFRFLATTIVFSEMYSKKLSRESDVNLFSKLGTTVKFLTFSTDNWVSMSKLRMVSTSSPKSEIRKGFSSEKEKTSTIPPRMENSPGSETKSTRWNS